MRKDFDNIIRLRLSIQDALLGVVTCNMRNISIDICESKIELCFIIDGEIRDNDEENISLVETEVIADFEDYFDIETVIKRLDYPTPIVLEHGYSVFQRKEH